MPIQTTCPQCQSSYRLPDTQMGKRVRCKKCQSVFIAGEVVTAPVLQEAPVVKPETMVAEELPVFDEVPTAPARSHHHAPPPRRAAVTDDRPPRREYDDPRFIEPAPRAGSSPLPLILGGVGALVVLGGLGLVAWAMMSGDSPPDLGQQPPPNQQPINPNPNPGGRKPINQGGGGRVEVPKPRDFATALAYLQMDDITRRREALQYLQTATVDASKNDELDRELGKLIEDPTHKREAMKVVLRWKGKHYMTALEEQMKDAFAWKEAMSALSRMDDDRAAELIAEHLGKVFHEEEAAKALKRMGKRGEKAAIKYLHHRRAGEHVRALVKEWKTDDETLATQALDDLSAREREIKDAASETLGGMTRPVEKLQDKVAAGLAAHMKDDWFGSRKKTAKALAIWATTNTLDTVHAYMNDRDLEVRVLMIAAAARLKDDRSIPHLVNRLGADEKQIAAKAILLYGSKAEDSVLLLLNHKERPVRGAGIELLTLIGTKKSVPILNKLAKVDTAAKRDVAAAVKAIEDREKKDK